MNREEIRMEIDDVDELLTGLFARRMRAARDMAIYKKEHGLPVRDEKREAEKLNEVSAMVPEEVRGHVKRLYETIFAISREYQEALMKDMV